VAELPSGAILAGYRLVRLLGRGGMGSVYLAEDVRLGRRVALKLLAPELAEDERFRERFLRESKLAASLDHPAIVPIFAAGESEGKLYIAMRYVEGSDLRALLTGGPLEPARALAIATQIASALDAAHRRGLVHRDVKPGNVLLDEDGNAYLSDFGLTKQATSQSGLTQTGQLVGTLDYVAPEQITGQPVDGRADVYSLACLLYECLTGRKPFARETEAATLWAHVHEPPPTTGDTAVDAVLAKALAKHPENRHTTAGALVREVTAALGLTAGQLALPAKPRHRRRLYAGLAGLTAAAVAAAVAVALLTGSSNGVTVLPNSVAVIDPESGELLEDIPIDARGPAAITAGDGAVWVGSLDDNTLTRINPETRNVERTIPLDGTPTGLAAANGAVWVATGNTETGNVYHVDPQYNRVTDIAHVAVEEGLLHTFGVRTVAARGRDVWVGNLDATAVELDPTTGKNKKKVVVGGGHVPGLALGFGSLWMGSDNTKEVSRIDLVQGVLTKTIAVGDGPSNIAVGAGAVWVANRLDDTVTRVDPEKNGVVSTIAVGRHPLGIAVATGAVWVAESRAGTLSRIDPRTNKVVQTVAIGNQPTGLAVSGGKLWVTVLEDPFARRGTASVAQDGSVLRIIRGVGGFDSTDPAFAYGLGPGGSWQLEQATCAKLVNYPDKPAPAGALLVPEVARALPVISDAGKTYAFTIRSGFRFSPPSNQPVTAQAFKSTIERTLSSRMRGWVPQLGYLNAIVGVPAYQAGKAAHITGIVARGNTLTIHLTRPDATLPTKLAMPFFCAVPVGTPLDTKGLPTVPGAGPYYLASHTPGRSAILKRNPNYGGSRPQRWAEIDYVLDVSDKQAYSEVEADSADYDPFLPRETLARSRARYGEKSPAARAGHQQLFRNPNLGIVYLNLNTRRPLFSSPRMRRALNFAIDRDALVRLRPRLVATTDQYLPPGMPGFRDAAIYPSRPDLREARRLAGPGKHGTAIMYSCEEAEVLCPQEAAIVKRALAAIGIETELRTFAYSVFLDKQGRADQPFDVAVGVLNWAPDFLDPSGNLNVLFGGEAVYGGGRLSFFREPDYTRKLDAADRLTGPGRYRPYGDLDVELARDYAPWVPYGLGGDDEFFARRVGCQVYQPSIDAMDLAALCIR
jgi:YVTN family beta-propeller protein